MRIETLLSPGVLANGFKLRQEAAKAISAVELAAGRTPGGKTTTAASLNAFFVDCASKVSGLADATAPTVVSSVEAGDVVTITFSEVLDAGVVPALSAFAFTPARTVTAVEVVGDTVLVTATGAIPTDTIAYVQPAVNALRDRAGNLVASFSGAVA